MLQDYDQPALFSKVERPVQEVLERKQELEDIHQLINKNRLVQVTAPSGMGKTLLMRHLCFEFMERKRFHDGIVKIDLTESDLTSITAEMVTKLLRRSPIEVCRDKIDEFSTLLEVLRSMQLQLLFVIKCND
jgi:type II secretory pathway predicted ATPase ExeA